MHADRNLLFGILALQMDFISPAALIAAMHAWVVDKTKSLGQILRDQQALGADEQSLLDGLVRKHIERHNDDPEKSLAAVGAAGLIREQLQQVRDPEVQATLAKVLGEGACDPYTTSVSTIAFQPGKSAGMRYAIVRPHAKGGLGEVFVALDQELHREVALKEIQVRHQQDPVSRARFVQEAEITGRLEHPGIVPVYGFGHYEDGRPYYAMRFIKGDSLKEAIARFHRQKSQKRVRESFLARERRQQGEKGQKGPEKISDPFSVNVEFRQLLRRLMDVCNAVAYAHSRGILHRDLKPGNIMLGKFGETLVVDWGLAKPLKTDFRSPTEFGSLSETEALELSLSERPILPLTGSGSMETLAGSALGTPAYMSPEQAAGRQDLLTTATDVYGLGATLYVLLTGQPPFGGSEADGVLRHVQRGEFKPPRAIDASIAPALQAICLKAMALEAKDRYHSARALADDLEHWLADEPVSAYREPLRRRLGRWGRRHPAIVSGAAALLLTGLIGLGLGLAAVRAEEVRTAQQRDQAQENLELANANFELARKAVDECYGVAMKEPLLQQESMRKIRKLLLEKALPFYEGFQTQRRGEPGIEATLAENYFRLASITAEIGRKTAAIEAYEQARLIREKLVAAQPEAVQYQSDLASTYNGLGNLQCDTGQPAAAAKSYDQARQIRAKLVAAQPEVPQYQSDLATTYNNLGLLERETGQLASAAKSYAQAGTIQEKLVAAHPEVTQYQNNLARTYLNLGLLQRDIGQPDAASKSYAQASTIQEKLVAAQPGVTEYQSLLARIYHDLGVLQSDTGQPAAAAKSYDQARQIQEKLVAAHPEVTQYQFDLATTYYDLGNLQSASGQPAAALKFYDRGLGILRPVASKHPEDQELPTRLVDLRLAHAAALAYLGQHDQATAEAEKIAEEKSLSGLNLYNLACVFSVASAAAHKDEKLSPAERDQRPEKYAAQAIEFLTRAQTAGYLALSGNVKWMKKDKDLDPLRSRADFKKLLADFEAKAKS